ncbi:MAG: hypothetical protein ISS17_07350 [Bacteroidales bacterium]|nr:hypothetical protein [Deltaproteobacteria bacterium]MBL7138572.1 hypothetical protein [Bacteroidales bacterium]
MKKLYPFIILAACLTFTSSCKKFERLIAVITISANESSLLVKGEVIDVAESTVEYGFCWGTTTSPTLANSYIKVGTTSSAKLFETTLSGLQVGTYYVRAYAQGDQGTVYGDPVKLQISSPYVEYYYDDGDSDYGWRYNAGYEGWMGNKFPITTSGTILSIEMYFNHVDGSGNDVLNVDVFNASRNQIGSTSDFYPGDDSWVSINANINYSGAIYVMAHWDYTQEPTNYLGMDQNGPNAYMDLGYYRDGDLSWGKCSSLTSGNQQPGVFLVRLHVQLSSGKTVTYTPQIDPGTNQLIMTEAAGIEAMDTKNKNND